MILKLWFLIRKWSINSSRKSKDTENKKNPSPATSNRVTFPGGRLAIAATIHASVNNTILPSPTTSEPEMISTGFASPKNKAINVVTATTPNVKNRPTLWCLNWVVWVRVNITISSLILRHKTVCVWHKLRRVLPKVKRAVEGQFGSTMWQNDGKDNLKIQKTKKYQ